MPSHQEIIRADAKAKHEQRSDFQQESTDVARQRFQALRDEMEDLLSPEEINLMLHQGIVEKKDLHVYILDAMEDNPAHDVPCLQSEHYQKQKMFRTSCQTLFDCEVHPVQFPARSKPEVVIEYFERALRERNRKDLIMMYFHGGAGYNSSDYTWKFSGYPKKEVDAYPIIKMFVSSGFDVKLLLDCWVPTRFRNKWISPRQIVRPGMVEIIARGEILQRPDGSLADEGAGDFTWAMCLELHIFLRRIMETKDSKEKYTAGIWKFQHDPISIPELLATNKAINSNPKRVWINRPQKGREDFIARMVMLPDHIRATKRLSFFMMQIQGIEMYNTSPRRDSDGRDVDEGFNEDDGEVGEIDEREDEQSCF